MKAPILIFMLLYNFTCNGQNLNSSIARNDNDYAPYIYMASESMINNPNPVKKKIAEILKRINYNNKYGQCISYKIFIDDTSSIYVLIVDYNFHKEGYLFCYNRVTNGITKEPIHLNLKWAFNNEDGFNFKLLDYPLAKVDSSKNQIYLKERVHNGTSYNAVITKVYKVHKDMSLSLEFCYESKSFTPELNKINRILIGSAFFCYEQTDTSLLYLGKINVDFESKRIISKDCANQSFCSQLFTTSGEDEEQIWRMGFRLSY